MGDEATGKVKKRAGKRVHSAVSAHAAEKARQIHETYGPTIDYQALVRILEDRKSIRYPVEIKFTSEGIEPGLFARTESVSRDPADGYVICIHADFREREDALPALILYQAVLINYGDLATAADAEIFGAGVLGMDRDEYYTLICDLCDSIWETR